VSSSADSSVKVWDLSLGDCIQTLFFHNATGNSLIRLSDCKFAVGYEKIIRVGDERGDWIQQIHTGVKKEEEIFTMVRVGDVIVTASGRGLEMRHLRYQSLTPLPSTFD